jgi:hypothetical protein
MAEMERYNLASSTILAQVGAALRSSAGPFAGYQVRHMIMGGHSGTGRLTTIYIRRAHETQRLAHGAPVYDGFFPCGAPTSPFTPRDVPIIQLCSDADIYDSEDPLRWATPGREYRRPDSDDSKDRYRLYELAGLSHMGTRYPPHNNPRNWPGIPPTAVMNSLPHHELFTMGLHHLVQWVTQGVKPPRAARIELDANKRFLAKDEHGNTIGGVRCAQLDVPRATYFSNPTDANGKTYFGGVGTEVAFDAAKMRRLYGTPVAYVARFDRRLDELISAGWFPPESAENSRAEARAQSW